MAHHPDAAQAADAHEEHDLAHEVEIDELESDEPRTPVWMPLLGGGLFLVGALTMLSMQPAGKTTLELRTAAVAAAAAAEAAKAAEEAAKNPPPAPEPAMPGGAAAAPKKGG
ncbi:MAG: hypothetical protein R3B13_06335 [Polyangiaceae bacterium]